MKLENVRRPFVFLFLAVAAVLIASPHSISGQSGASQYNQLKLQTRQLFNKWAAAQDAAEGVKISAGERFAALPVSRRSTFASISNGLLFTKLNDETGRPLGTAIDLIDEIETIAGQEEGKGSDEQYRLYVKLKPDALKTLDASREFQHGKNNTVYHKGYPINYRQAGSPPTLQYSITTDGLRADVDIDYRSSGFPAALFNGHLSASNSDVRASGNYPTYVRRFPGLVNWWDEVFPDLIAEFARLKNRNITPQLIPPGSEKAPDAEAVAATANAFFKAWLIDRDVDRAISYLHSRIFFCSDLKSAQEKESLTARYEVLFLDTLKAANKELKNVKTLEQAIRPVVQIDPYIKAVDHAGKNSYLLAVITDDDYKHFVCASKSSAMTTPNGGAQTYGKYYVVKFQFALETGTGGVLRLLWAKEDGRWTIRAFDAVTA